MNNTVKIQLLNEFGAEQEQIERLRNTPIDCKLTLNFETEENTEISYCKYKEIFENHEKEIFFENRKNLKYLIKTLFKEYIKENENNVDGFINKYKRIIKKDDKYYLINTCSLNETMIKLTYGTISCTTLISKSKIKRKFDNLLIHNDIEDFDIDNIDIQKFTELLKSNPNFLDDIKCMTIDIAKLVIDEIKKMYFVYNTRLIDIASEYANKKNNNLPIDIIYNSLAAINYVKNSDIDTLIEYTNGNYFNSFLPSDKT